MGIYGLAIDDIVKFDQNEFTLPFLNYSTGIHALYSGID